jgi:single-stranded-DNA-specific exonuclease
MYLRQRFADDSASSLPSHLHPLVRRVYAHRGVKAEEVDLSLKNLLPPTLLKGLPEAALYLAEAIEQQKRIVIAGDYDADGATGTALAVLGLRALGAKHVSYVVPDRFTMGYGLSPALADMAHEQGAEVLVTVDNGIASVAGVAHAKALGLTVVITDHHLAGDALPEADALVNPNQPDCPFPSKHLAGVGVMFYTLIGLRQTLRERGHEVAVNLADFLDIVALGTVADLVKLDGNNRILVQAGIERIRSGRCRWGILALLKIAGTDPQKLQASDFGFKIGPRINAAGRLEDIRTGIECLLAESESQAMPLAQALDTLNRERRRIEDGMKENAFTQLEQLPSPLPAGLCLHHPDWHEGVVGLVASRIKDRAHRPTLAFAIAHDAGLLKGSARSIPGFHLRDALAGIHQQHPHFIHKFGGHAMAAGLTVYAEHFEAFTQAFADYCAEHLAPELLAQQIDSDGELHEHDLELSAALALEQAGPYGQGFPEPCFDGEFVLVSQFPMGKDNQFARYLLETSEGKEVYGVDFHAKKHALEDGDVVHLVYKLAVNRYKGREDLQLMIEAVNPE